MGNDKLYSPAHEVVDAAHDLTHLCVAVEHYDDAIWATEHGLLTDALSEVLDRDLMQAADATGNYSRDQAAMVRLR